MVSSAPHFKSNSSKPEKYVDKVEYSSWNPPPQRRRIIGDFFYLSFRTLEGEEYHATAFSKGFYINKSTSDNFDPAAESELFYSVLDLVASKSSSFKGKKDLGLFSNVNLELKNIDLPKSLQPTMWFKQERPMENHKADSLRANQAIYNTYGYNPVVYRDWNEDMITSSNTAEAEIYGKLTQKKT